MERNGALDLLKIVLALMVVGIHAGFLSDVSELAAFLALNGLFRIAVPVFLVINGYFFYQKTSTGTGTPSLWFKRALQIYLVWMAVYFPFWLMGLSGGAIYVGVKLIYLAIFGYFHLWYLAGMIGAAALVLALSKAGSRVLLGVAIASFIGGVTIQYAANYQLLSDGLLSKLVSKPWSHRNFMFLSFPFCCAGYLINKHQLHRHFTLVSATALGGLGVVLVLAEAFVNFNSLASLAPFDNLIALALVAPAIFVMGMKMTVPTSSKNLALYSTGIYLTHVIVLYSVQALMRVPPTALTLITAMLATLVTYFVVALHRRLPVFL